VTRIYKEQFLLWLAMTIVLLYVLVQSVLVHSVASIIKCKIQQLAQDIVSHLHATQVHGKMRGRCCIRDVWHVSAVAVTT